MGSEEDADWFDTVLDAVEALNLFRTPRRIVEGPDVDASGLEGEVLVGGRWVTVRLSIGNAFPLELPCFYLRPWDALGFIPHVDATGLICFKDPEGLVLDRRRPVDIVRETFVQALGVLEVGVSGRNRNDFADEFGAYWKQLSKVSEGVEVFSVFDPVDDVRQLVIATCKGKEPVVAADQNNLSAFYNGRSVASKYTLQNAVYLPLDPNTVLIPPRPDGPMWSAEEARHALLSAVSEVNMARLRRLVKGRRAKREYVIVRLPRSSEGDTLFGIRYDEVGDAHPLLDCGTAARLVPLQVERLDRKYLVRRGGGDVDLDAARVLLVGCGSLGGHIAFDLARTGIQNLTLVDRDRLKPENTYRHILGRRYWGTPKALALASEIEQEVPYVQVNGMESSIEKALGDGSVDLAAYDLVVCALGNPTVELAMNKRLYALQGGPMILFTWLEPLGIGGHALLVADRNDNGCFECLYTSVDDVETLDNRASFAESGQTFGQALSGCGSMHTPYGSVDAVQTAVQAVRLAVDALIGREIGNPLVSWKGDASAFKEAGYHLSGRYITTTTDALHDQRYAYWNPKCRVCNADQGGGE